MKTKLHHNPWIVTLNLLQLKTKLLSNSWIKIKPTRNSMDCTYSIRTEKKLEYKSKSWTISNQSVL